jgi:hypothetical protein
MHHRQDARVEKSAEEAPDPQKTWAVMSQLVKEGDLQESARLGHWLLSKENRPVDGNRAEEGVAWELTPDCLEKIGAPLKCA